MILTRLRKSRIHLLILGVSTLLAAGATHLHQQRQAQNLAQIQQLNNELEAYRAEQRQFLKEQAP
jgi:hypothetical protein